MLANLKIGQRLYLGFGVVLVVLALVAVLNLFGVLNATDRFVEYNEIS